MRPIRLIQVMILILSILKAFTMITGARAQAPEAAFSLYIPAMIKTGERVPPPPPPTDTQLPAELVTTWYTGALPLNDFYDPATGTWRAQNGLGETYTFSANGDYTYAGFLRLQNGQCFSEVSVYREGKASVAGDELTLKPDFAKTRTVVRCGSNSDTTTDGPFDATTIGYDVVEEANGHIQLTLSSNDSSTSFYRDGMVASLVGAWQRGDVTSVGFYDPATQSFAPQSGEGGWYRFEADGTYRFGEFGYGTNDQGCALTAWIYQEGTVSVSGGRLTTTPTAGALRVDNACAPGAPEVQPYVEEARSYTWLYRDRDTDPKLVIIPLEAFQEYIFQPE
jgi:hypothetical protein